MFLLLLVFFTCIGLIVYGVERQVPLPAFLGSGGVMISGFALIIKALHG